MAVSFKGAHFPKEVILMGVRWYVAYSPPYTFFLLNGDMKLHRNRQFFI
jgi:transposase-like protein